MTCCCFQNVEVDSFLLLQLFVVVFGIFFHSSRRSSSSRNGTAVWRERFYAWGGCMF